MDGGGSLLHHPGLRSRGSTATSRSCGATCSSAGWRRCTSAPRSRRRFSGSGASGRSIISGGGDMPPCISASARSFRCSPRRSKRPVLMALGVFPSPVRNLVAAVRRLAAARVRISRRRDPILGGHRPAGRRFVPVGRPKRASARRSSSRSAAAELARPVDRRAVERVEDAAAAAFPVQHARRDHGAGAAAQAAGSRSHAGPAERPAPAGAGRRRDAGSAVVARTGVPAGSTSRSSRSGFRIVFGFAIAAGPDVSDALRAPYGPAANRRERRASRPRP